MATAAVNRGPREFNCYVYETLRRFGAENRGEILFEGGTVSEKIDLEDSWGSRALAVGRAKLIGRSRPPEELPPPLRFSSVSEKLQARVLEPNSNYGFTISIVTLNSSEL